MTKAQLVQSQKFFNITAFVVGAMRLWQRILMKNDLINDK